MKINLSWYETEICNQLVLKPNCYLTDKKNKTIDGYQNKNMPYGVFADYLTDDGGCSLDTYEEIISDRIEKIDNINEMNIPVDLSSDVFSCSVDFEYANLYNLMDDEYRISIPIKLFTSILKKFNIFLNSVPNIDSKITIEF